jgi:hypothetical protein
METLISSAVLILGLILLWTGRQRLGVSSFVATLLSIVELAGFVVAVVTLGWIGLAIVVAVSLVAAVVWSVVLAARKEAILVSASAQGADVSVSEAEELWRWMGRETAFAVLHPLKRAELIRALTAQARNPTEIRAMAVPIAQLALVFDCDPEWLTPRFDQLLRLYDRKADDAVAVADQLTRSTQLAAASFEEMVEAMLAVGDSDGLPGTANVGRADAVGRNDEFRENLRAIVESQLQLAGEEGIRLNGGPMDGWLVKADAPSLAPDWHRTWPPTTAKEFGPGRYVLADRARHAVWTPLDR